MLNWLNVELSPKRYSVAETEIPGAGEEGDYNSVPRTLSLELCHLQNDSRMTTCSAETHFNIPLIVRIKATNRNLLEEKGEPKRIRTEVLLR